jgi:hypothetical protein
LAEAIPQGISLAEAVPRGISAAEARQHSTEREARSAKRVASSAEAERKAQSVSMKGRNMQAGQHVLGTGASSGGPYSGTADCPSPNTFLCPVGNSVGWRRMREVSATHLPHGPSEWPLPPLGNQIGIDLLSSDGFRETAIARLSTAIFQCSPPCPPPKRLHQ